jgi:HEAT repeat protein
MRRRGPRATFAALCFAVGLGTWSLARADQLDGQIRQVRAEKSYKLRLSAALALSRSKEPRAVEALADALVVDTESTIRNVAALSLGKNVDARTPTQTRDRALSALAVAARRDTDTKVRTAAAASLELLKQLRDAPPAGAAPQIFVNIDTPADLTKKAPEACARGIRDAVRGAIKHGVPDYATDWPNGKLPTMSELSKAGTRGYYVGASLSVLEVEKKGSRSEVKCTVSIRVNPWTGRDGKEKWESNKTASASGSGRAIGGASDAGAAAAAQDCVMAVAEEITAKQVIPFIRRLAAAE